MFHKSSNWTNNDLIVNGVDNGQPARMVRTVLKGKLKVNVKAM